MGLKDVYSEHSERTSDSQKFYSIPKVLKSKRLGWFVQDDENRETELRRKYLLENTNWKNDELERTALRWVLRKRGMTKKGRMEQAQDRVQWH
jgi:hypothetical protein